MSGNKKAAIFLVGIFLIPTIFVIAIIYGNKYANDPVNIVGYATHKWSDKMKKSVVENQFQYGTETTLSKDAKFILYDLQNQKFEKLDWGGEEERRYLANNPDEISIIVVYRIGTKNDGQIRTTTNKGQAHYSDASADYVEIALIDVNTWKVFATHTSYTHASVKNPHNKLSSPTSESFRFINHIIEDNTLQK